MRRRDLVELTLIAATAGAAALGRAFLPAVLPAGEAALAASGLLLGQGLIRDLWIKYSLRKSGTAGSCTIAPGRKATCLCMESTLGIFGVLAGAGALLGGVRSTLALGPWFWPSLVLGTGLLGFALKSLVIDWKTRRLRRETDHENVRF